MIDRAGASAGIATILVALTSSACMESVRPVLGALRIGPAMDGPFVTPMLISDRMPFRYPENAWERGVGGETVLRLHISESGIVDTVAVFESSGDAVLDSAAVAGALQLRYKPAHRGDRPVSVWAFLPVRFPLPEAASVEDEGRL